MRKPIRLLLVALAGAVALSGLETLPATTASAKPSPSSDHRLVRRSPDGHVTFLGSTDARVLAASPQAGSAAANARAHLDQLGRALGLADPRAELTSTRTTALGAGRSLVRFDQQISGRPVFAGQAVVSLGADGSLISVLSDVSSASEVPAASVAQANAISVARRLTAKSEHVLGKSLSVEAQQVVFDPSVVHVGLPGGARPAWQVDLSNGADVRELVIVDGVSGRVVLHFNQVADALNRRVCNNHNVRRSTDVPCTTPVRSEGDGPVGNAQINDAYRIAGQTANAYADIAGIDLTEFIGKGKVGHRQLRSTINWCVVDPANTTDPTSCPGYANAYWDGSEMYYGSGMASADDVVAHELTHGVTQHTSNLLYLYQSGAMNESFSDIFGEIVDHRYQQPGESPNTEWLLGEDSPLGALRNMADPTSPPSGALPQPDKMTSSWYAETAADNGGVHINSGVGNHLFYLIAHGGTFNSQTVTAIDTDPTLPKSARLFYEALVSLTRGSVYADLGNVLEQRCADLAFAGTLGFSPSDCDQVHSAILATELEKSPTGDTAKPVDAPDDCPVGTFKRVLLDGEAQQNQLSSDNATMWTRAPNKYSPFGVPANARSGIGSWFVWDPDPYTYGDPTDTTLSTVSGISIPTGQPTYVRFEQWRAFEYDNVPTFFDGGTLDVSKDDGSGTYVPYDTSGLTWDNGPGQTLAAGSNGGTYNGPGFGGDFGWVSSRLELTPLQGSKVKLGWTSHGDASNSFYGWFLDNIEVYTCGSSEPRLTSPNRFKVVATGSAAAPAVRLRWFAPSKMGSGVVKYQLVRTGGGTREVIPGDPLPVTWGGLKVGQDYGFEIQAIDQDGRVSPVVGDGVRALKVTSRVSKSLIHRGDGVALYGRVTWVSTGSAYTRHRIYLLYKRPKARKWQNAGWKVTNSTGNYALHFRPARTFVYRIYVFPKGDQFAAQSPIRKIRVVR